MCPSVCFPSVQLWREVVALSLPLCVFVFVCPSVFFAECASVAWGGGAQDWTNIVK